MDFIDNAQQPLVNGLFSSPPEFLLSAMHIDQLPQDQNLEVAFVGRSNVGKSSLINKITGQRQLARTSKEPGRTRALNLFALRHKDAYLRLVDMPGYGYAKAPKEIAREWQGLIADYLRGRVYLRRLYLLIDARHGLKENDKEVIKMLDKAGISTRLVLTKADKISFSARAISLETLEKAIAKHPSCLPQALMTSSEKNIGIEEVRHDIASLINGFSSIG